MSLNFSFKDNPQIFGNYDSQQPFDEGQYKNFNLTKFQNVQNNVHGSLSAKKSNEFLRETTKYDRFNAAQNNISINEKWSKEKENAKALKFSSFGENYVHLKNQNKNCNASNKNNSTLSLHIEAYENSVVKNEGKLSTEKDKKKMVTKTWKTINHLFDSNDPMNIFEIPRQQKGNVTEPDVMQFKASQQLLDPHQIPLMPASNTETLEKNTERDGQKIVLSENKLAEEVSFLFNNLSFANYLNKVDDLRQILDKHDDTCRKWLAQYLVMKRITLEQNFHSLYNSFLIELKDKKLNHYVKQETLRNIKILLKSDKKIDTSNWSFDDRQLLKNLGRWLGLITIGRNEVLFMKELDLNGLLLEASSKSEQEILYIVPFVVKILESSAISLLFKPCSAWVSQLLQTLAFIYMQPDIKLAIKFEYEVLCQHLNVPLRCVLPAYSYLPHENAASVESNNPMIFFPIYDYNEIDIYDQIDMHFDIPVELPLFHIFPALSSYCRKAISDAIRENMDEMVKRAGAAAILLTEDLINKDFAFCPDPQQMRFAYLFMVRSLTSGAGMVTSKEPLTTSIIGHLRRLIQHQLELSGDNDPDLARMADATMVHILEKNIELACCYVVKTACEKAMVEIDKKMEDAVQRRRNGMKLEISPEIQAIIDSIPQELRPSSGPFDEDTFEVYKTFGAQIIGFKFTDIIDPIVNHLPPPENYCQEPFQYPVITASQFQERVEFVFADWTKFCAYSCFAPSQIVGPYLAGLMEKYFLPFNDQYMIRFLKAALDISTNVSYELLSNADKTFGSILNSRSNSCYTVDAFAKLACFYVRNAASDEGKLEMINRILEMVTTTLLVDHDIKCTKFNGLPMLRIFVTLIKEFCRKDKCLFKPNDPFYGHFAESVGRALNEIQPRRAPAFAFHWLEILGHRHFLTAYLSPMYTSEVTRAVYARLFAGHIKFLAPCFRNVDLPSAIHSLYMGTIRLMFLILHDFPEMFCEYYYVFCDVIPPNCVQLRNIVLSAFPSNMKLPDPYNKSFEAVGASREMNMVTKLSSKMFTSISASIRSQLDNFLKNPLNPKFLKELLGSLKISDVPGSKYNAPCINAAIYFIGLRGISKIKEKKESISMLNIGDVTSMKAFQILISSFCTEGRYLLFNALANQLRYPNAQTHYFACTILYLFKKATTDAIREQITRCLFERILAVRPHPWGILYIFRELFTNVEYGFWGYEFVRGDPQIERKFITVAKTWNVVITPKVRQEPSEPKSKKVKKF